MVAGESVNGAAATSAELAGSLDALADSATYPDGRSGRVLSLDHVTRLAETFGLSPREIEIAALKRDIVPVRYQRNLFQYAPAEQLRLLRSRVAMVGLGGLGGHVLELLVRAGVGTVACADGDVFEESNLNRQLLAETATLGRSKARAAVERAARINPGVSVLAREAFLDEAAMKGLLAGADLVLDCLGGLKDRPLLARAAREAGLPLVIGAVAGLTGLVATATADAPSPLDLFGASGGAAEDSLGCPAPAVAAVAAIQAAEAVNILTGRKPALAGKVLVIDLGDMSFETVRL